jgi:hypothetical protein
LECAGCAHHRWLHVRAHLDLLDALMLNGAGGEVDDVDVVIVAVDKCDFHQWCMEFLK